MELYYLIKKDNELYNSEYIFNYYTLGIIHKKHNNFEVFLKTLKTEIKKTINICKNEIGDKVDDEDIKKCKR